MDHCYTLTFSCNIKYESLFHIVMKNDTAIELSPEEEIVRGNIYVTSTQGQMYHPVTGKSLT